VKAKLARGFTLIELLVVITIIAILAGLSVPVFAKIQEKGYITKGTNNVRQIYLGLKLYASDYDGRYPTGTDSNEAFRKLVEEQIIEKEDVFGCPQSDVGQPDGNLGEPPNYLQALERNENHWMMVAGLSDSSSAAFPILFENALGTDSNPRWDPTKAGLSSRGRTWSGGKVIVATNDGAVKTYSVDSKDSVSSLKPPAGSDKNIFQQAGGGTLEVLDVKSN
jgi:prepilin-type N-terminal cleavage/methylation domain-containing protein